MKPDKIDYKIIDTLQKDGRITKQTLAERISLSPSACLERMRRLEDNGYIRGYHADIAMEKLASYSAVIVEITLKHHQADHFHRFENAIMDIPQIVECYSVGGGIDYILKFVVQSIEHYQDIMDKMLNDDIGIERYFSYFVTKQKKKTFYPVMQFLSETE